MGKIQFCIDDMIIRLGGLMDSKSPHTSQILSGICTRGVCNVYLTT